MKRSNRLVLLVGVFLAVLAFVGIALLFGSPKTDPNTPKVVTELPTVIASKDIALGVTVTADMLKTENKNIDGARKNTAFQDPGLVIGKITRRVIKTDSQLEAADFDTSTTGCGTIDVPPTFRAMSIQVDQVSGVGTVINTGDYTDLLVGFTGDKFPVVTLNPTDDSIGVVSGLNGTSVKLLLEGMQVLCRQLPPIAAPADGSTPPPATSEGQPTTSLNGQQEIVILAVTAAQAEVIKFAQLDGSVSLILRSAKDFVDENGNPLPPAPSGTEGITLKKLTTDFSVPIPELVEAILPAQAAKP
ncbi:MAG: Flp pilus assembly protein CpaB [Chloroflexi bacterium]|nr:Flp pilus assembly protein CpaB [Chloroflexota bacterium]